MNTKLQKIIDIQMPLALLMPAIVLFDLIKEDIDFNAGFISEHEFKQVESVLDECQQSLIDYVEKDDINLQEILAKISIKFGAIRKKHEAFFGISANDELLKNINNKN